MSAKAHAATWRKKLEALPEKGEWSLVIFRNHCEPYAATFGFTKESLLYRDIFEKFYPGQAGMVIDFWMPNRSWEGCDVNDPSARVLSNYGDSGT